LFADNFSMLIIFNFQYLKADSLKRILLKIIG